MSLPRFKLQVKKKTQKTQKFRKKNSFSQHFSGAKLKRGGGWLPLLGYS